MIYQDLSTNLKGFQSNWDRFSNALIFNNHKQIPSLLNLNDSKCSNNKGKVDYFEYMSKPGNYGTFTELTAASELFGFIGLVIQIFDGEQFNCYDFGISNIPELNEKKPLLFLVFSGPPKNGHFRLLKPASKKPVIIQNGIYYRTSSDETNVISMSNMRISNVVKTSGTETKYTCKLCPNGDQKSFATKKGLRIHSALKHRGIPLNDSKINEDSSEEKDQLKYIGTYKRKFRLLHRIPKGARILAASMLTSILNDCISNNDDETAWENLLLFSYKALHAPEKSKSNSLVASVKLNISNFVLPHVNNLKGYKRNAKTTEEKLIERVEAKVADFDIRGAVRLLTSSDSIAISDNNTLHELQQKHPSPSRPLEYPEPPTEETEFYIV